jgi:Ca2+:H+ antiporter
MTREGSLEKEAAIGMSARAILAREWFLGVGLAACAIFLLRDIGADAPRTGLGGMAAIFVALFAVMLGLSFGAVRHADQLAERLGEPYGTLILTLSVSVIEAASVSAVMLHGQNNPTLLRDSLFAVVMIILNGMVGVSLLIGAWRHREQNYNLQGANSYLGLILPLTVFSLVLPSFTRTTPGPTLSLHQSLFLILASVGLYAAFLAVQTGRHREYFAVQTATTLAIEAPRRGSSWPTSAHALLLAGYLIPIVVLAEQLARPIDYFIETLKAPTALGGLAVAVLVAAPEALGALRAALDNQLQRSVNIFLGSVLATICLTIPLMLAISALTGRSLILGVEGVNRVMLLLTLAVSIVTFSSGRTNVLQGAVHLLLFGAYLLLIFEG